MSRSISDAWFYRIKAATRDLIRACGTVERAADLAHVSKSEVSRWQSASDPDIITLAAVIALEGECALPLVTAVLADLNGRCLADEEEVSAAQVAGHHAEAMQKAAALMAEGARALADGALTPAEALGLDRSIAALEADLSRFRGSLAKVRASGGTKRR